MLVRKGHEQHARLTGENMMTGNIQEPKKLPNHKYDLHLKATTECLQITNQNRTAYPSKKETPEKLLNSISTPPQKKPLKIREEKQK